MQIALRIEVPNQTAALIGVPALLALLKQYEAQASFYFTLGPDRAGQARGPLFALGSSRAEQRAYRKLAGPRGWARLHGRGLAAPSMAAAVTGVLHAIQAQQHDIGLLGWDWVGWVNEAASAPATWTESQFSAARAEWAGLGLPDCASQASPGWRGNPVAFRLQQRHGLRFASDTRGRQPFLPVVRGEPVRVPQYPTTLPTLPEQALRLGPDQNRWVTDLLAATATASPWGQVFSLRADAEGRQWHEALHALFSGWQQQGHTLVSLRQLHEAVKDMPLTWHEVVWQDWPGYAGKLMVQGEPFPD